MMPFLRLWFQAAFIENMALSFFLGMCTFLAISQSMTSALGLGAAVVLVQTVTVPANYVIYTYLLREDALLWAGISSNLSFLGLLSYIAVIASLVQILEMFLERYVPRLSLSLGIFLPLITVNCAILGGTLFMVERQYNFLESVVYGFGTGCGWAFAIVLLAAIRRKLRYADPPEGLQGLGLVFMTAGLLALAFLGVSGLRF